MKIKTAALILLILLQMSIASCSGDSSGSGQTLSDDGKSAPDTAAGTESTAETEAETTLIKDSLPNDLDFEGASFNMLSGDEYGGICLVEEETGNILNDMIYYSQRSAEERLNIVISETPSSFWKMNATVQKLVSSGDPTYSCVNMMDRFALTSAQKNSFYPIQEVEYIDTSREYWGGKLTDSLSVGQNSFFAVGSLNLSTYYNVSCVYINNDLAAANSIEIPYEDVYTEDWTLDKLISLGEGVCADLNGDGVMNENDRYALGASDMRHIANVILIGSGEFPIEKDSNDKMYFAADGDERFYDVINRVKETFFDSATSPLLEKGNIVGTGTEIFISGNMLSIVARFSEFVALRDCDFEFTVMPVPKYNETQEGYYSRTYDSIFLDGSGHCR